MGTIEALCKEYERQVCLRWDDTLAGPQRVWFAVYEPSLERRLRLRVPLFEEATKKAGHGWERVDLTDAFANWMAGHEYRDSYFASPELLDIALPDFATDVATKVRSQLQAPAVDEQTVVAISGVASVFGLASVSQLVEDVAPSIQGRMLVFFPGHHEGSSYRLLDARDGWNYLAVAITSTNGKGEV